MCITGGPIRARPIRAQGGPQGPVHKGPGTPTSAQGAPQGPHPQDQGAGPEGPGPQGPGGDHKRSCGPSPCGLPWALLVGRATVAPLSPFGPRPCGHPWAFEGRALVGLLGQAPVAPPWALVGRALVTPPGP